MIPSNKGYMNIVRDYNKAQGITHPGDLSYQIIRDYHIRHVSIENSGTRPIGVAITPYINGPIPKIRFTLDAGEIKHVGINSQGGPAQMIWMLDPQSGKPVNHPECLRRDANSFVLRDGLNKWYIQFFKFPSYHAG